MSDYEVPTVLVLVVAGAGLALAAAVDWELGVLVLAGAVWLAALLRLVLPPQRAGWLAVRTRAIDAGVLLALGVGLVVLATTIPRG